MYGQSGDVTRWLREARAGSTDALGRALDACRGYLLLVARKELAPDLLVKGGASDIVQETLLEAVRDFGRFEGGTEDDLLLWLRRLLLNNIVDFTRQFRDTAKRQVGREVPLAAGGSSAAHDGGLVCPLPSPSGEALAGEDTEAVRRAIEALPEDYRRVILLRYQEGRAFEEVGQALGLTPNAARKLLLRAIRRVREELGEAR